MVSYTEGIASENGVTGYRDGDGDYVLTIPGRLLHDLQAAWQTVGPTALTEYGAVVEAVRELFDGQDGALQYLAVLGVPTEPR